MNNELEGISKEVVQDLMSGMIVNVVMVMKAHKLVLSAIAGSGIIVADTGYYHEDGGRILWQNIKITHSPNYTPSHPTNS